MKTRWLPALIPSLLLGLWPATIGAQTAGPVKVTISDTAYTPNWVSVQPGQTITWTNQGTTVHSVVTDAGLAPAIDSGGIDPGKSFSFTFPAGSAGTFTYHSSTEPSYSYDSLGDAIVRFALTGTVVVQTPSPSPQPSPAASATAGCQFVLGFKTLHDLDPADIGDCQNDQFTTPTGDAQQQTTKGLMVWRKADNWTAFTNGYMTWINGPAGLQSRLNTDRFPWEHDTPAAGAAATPTSEPTPSPDPLVVIDDTNGFTPSYVAIKAGHTVTWINKGTKQHSVVNDNGNPPFNSGALNPGQLYSYNFTLPNGHYTYHSTTEPTHLYKNADGVDTIGWQFTGTIDVN